jgi:hypothetical protein
MLGTSWPVTLLIAICALVSVALRPASSVRLPGRQRIAWLKTAAALRLISLLILALVSFIPLLDIASSLPLPARWALGAATTFSLLWCLVNTAAGLWLVSPFVGVDVGSEVVASKRRGIVRGYGLTRLELSTHAGGAAHLPYWSVAYRPLVVFGRDRPRSLEFTLRQQQWSDDEVRFLRQAAILSPFRALTSPVSVSRSGQVVTVRLDLAPRSREEDVRNQLERTLALFRSQSTRVVQGQPSESPLA